MGRYFPDDQSPTDTGMISNLRSNINNVGSFAIKQKLDDQNRKEKMKQVIQAALLKNMTLKQGADPNRILQDSGDVDFSQLTPVLKNPSKTSISISQRPLSEMIQAREQLSQTPQDWLKAGMATQEPDIPNSGIFGSNFLNKKGNIKLNPEVDQLLTQSRNVLGNPNRITKKISNADGNVLGNQDQGGGVDVSTTDSGMPDAGGYQEGTVVEDEDGQQFKVVNGQWVEQ